MKKFPSVYSDEESKVLIAIYENPGTYYDTYGVTGFLHPKVNVTSPEYEGAFKDAMKAIEGLIMRGYIDGEQLKGGLGMYYHNIKLKYAGKQAAIEERNRVTELEKRLPVIAAEVDEVAAEIARAAKKDKK